FVALMLRSLPVRGFISLLLRGQSGQTIKLRSDDIKDVKIPAVPMVAQGALTRGMTQDRDDVRAACLAIEYSIDLLAERRQALITAAVTGQIDVTTARGVDVS